MLVRTANREYADQTASSEARLNWICTVCLGLFDRNPVLEILEDLPYMNICCKLLYCSGELLTHCQSISEHPPYQS